MRRMIAGFVAGAGLLQIQPKLPDSATLAAAGCALLVLTIVLTALRTGAWPMPRSGWAVAVAGLLAGFCWAALLAHAALGTQLARADEGREITVVGTIDSLPYVFDRGVRFNFAVQETRGAHGQVPARIALAWYDGRTGQRAAPVQPGERWQFSVRLQRPHGNANPYGFDYEGYLLQQGVRATGYVRASGAPNLRLDPFVYSPKHAIERARAMLRARILAALDGRAYAGVIVALVVGDQRAIDQWWRTLNFYPLSVCGIKDLRDFANFHGQ